MPRQQPPPKLPIIPRPDAVLDQPTAHFRPLNVPAGVRVVTDRRGLPLSVQLRDGGRVYRVVEVLDAWVVEDGWWRPETQVDRKFYQVALDGGMVVTIYRDRRRDTWHKQHHPAEPGPGPSAPDKPRFVKPKWRRGGDEL